MKINFKKLKNQKKEKNFRKRQRIDYSFKYETKIRKKKNERKIETDIDNKFHLKLCFFSIEKLYQIVIINMEI